VLLIKSRKDSHTEPAVSPAKYHLLLAVEAWSRAGAPVAVCRLCRRATGESQSSGLQIVMQ
jgi:hypothetical protein